MDDKIKRFADMVRDSKTIVFFGGAGVSTESGLKDYRSADGIYNTYTKSHIPPEVILSVEFFEQNPEMFYEFYREYFISDVEPNRAHTAIAELEKLGKLVSVVTQNVDGLHQKAGSSRVFELHGSAAGYHCPACGKAFNTEYIADKSKAVPRCDRCGRVIETDVVLYGENLDENVIEQSIRAIWNADMLIIGGTSLTVYPAAGFIDYFRGKHLVVINKQATVSDGKADLVFRDNIGEVMTKMLERLKL